MKKVIVLTIALVLVLSAAFTVWAENDATDAEPKETVVNLYSGDFTNNLAAKWEVLSGGQKVTVPAGNLLKNLSVKMHALTDGVSSTASARLDIFAWNVDYGTTVAYDPLYTVEFTATNGIASFDIDTTEVKLSGDIYWEITATKYDEGQLCIVSGARGASPEGVENYLGGIKDGFVSWSEAKSIAATMTVVEDPDYVEPPVVETTTEATTEETSEVEVTTEVTTEETTEETSEVTTEVTTEETTEVTTEVTTEETTEVTTEDTTVADTTEADTTVADTTAAGTTAAGTTAATTEEAKGGCGSVVGSAIAVAVIAMAGAAAVVLKKRD